MSDGNFTNTIPRDRFDRPQIFPPPARGKTHADVVARFEKSKKNPPSYRRTTKFISVLEDTYNLDAWANRMVARGISERSDLALDAVKADLDTREGKDTLDIIVGKAKGHMRTGLKATLGSYLHYCCELKDLHGEHADLPSPAEWASLQNKPPDLRDDDYELEDRDADVAAYLTTKTHYGLRYTSVEQMRVNDAFKVAGTPDRTGFGDPELFHDKHAVFDVKTGSIDFDNSHREHAMQFAMYGHSTAYTQADGRIEDVPPLNQDWAYIIHLPVMEARCTLHRVDIRAGWSGCVLAQQVWEWRKRKGIVTLLDDWEPANHLEKLALNPTYAEAAVHCPSKEALRELWARAAANPGALDDSFKAAVKQRLSELDAQGVNT